MRLKLNTQSRVALCVMRPEQWTRRIGGQRTHTHLCHRCLQRMDCTCDQSLRVGNLVTFHHRLKLLA